MNPFGLFLISVGLLMIVIGFKGSQHNVLNAFKGIHGGTSTGTGNKSTGSSGSQDSGGGTIVGGGPGGTSMGVA